jgi:hypothetical protein
MTILVNLSKHLPPVLLLFTLAAPPAQGHLMTTASPNLGKSRYLDAAGGSNQNSGGRAPLDVDAAGVSSQKTGARDCLTSPPFRACQGRTGMALGESAARPFGHLSAHDSGGGCGGSDDEVHEYPFAAHNPVPSTHVGAAEAWV